MEVIIALIFLGLILVSDSLKTHRHVDENAKKIANLKLVHIVPKHVHIGHVLV